MADRRCFTMKIVDSDAFLEMPLSTQALYFHLNMRADDDGFVNNPKKIQRMIGASDDDMKVLIVKRFLIAYENGVIVIKHWRMHNTLKNDRLKNPQYPEIAARLYIKENGSYTDNPIEGENSLLSTKKSNGFQMDSKWIPDGFQMDTEEKGIEENITELNKTENEVKEKEVKHKYGEYKNVMLTDDELEKLKDKFPSSWESKIKNMDEAIALKGYKYKSHYLAILKWAEKDKPEKPANPFAEYKGVTV